MTNNNSTSCRQRATKKATMMKEIEMKDIVPITSTTTTTDTLATEEESNLLMPNDDSKRPTMAMMPLLLQDRLWNFYQQWKLTLFLLSSFLVIVWLIWLEEYPTLLILLTIVIPGSMRISAQQTIRSYAEELPNKVKSLDIHNQKSLLLVSYFCGQVEVWKTTLNNAAIISDGEEGRSRRMERISRFRATSIPALRAGVFMETTARCFDDEEEGGEEEDININKNIAIVTGGDDCYIRVFTLGGTKLLEFEAHSDFIRSLAVVHTKQQHRSFSSSSSAAEGGCLLLSASDDMTIRLWSIHIATTTTTTTTTATTTDNNQDNKYYWACQQIFRGHSNYVMMVKICPQQQQQHENLLFASASMDATIKFWELLPQQQQQEEDQKQQKEEEPEPKFSLRGGHHEGINAIDFCGSSEPSLLVSGGDDKMVCVWNYHAQQLLVKLQHGGHTDNVTCVIFLHHHNNIILSTSEDGTLQCWNYEYSNLQQQQQQQMSVEKEDKKDPEEGSCGGVLQATTTKAMSLLDHHHHNNSNNNGNNRGRGWALALGANAATTTTTFHNNNNNNTSSTNTTMLAIGFDKGCVCLDVEVLIVEEQQQHDKQVGSDGSDVGSEVLSNSVPIRIVREIDLLQQQQQRLQGGEEDETAGVVV